MTVVVGDNKQTNKHFLPLFFSFVFLLFFDDRQRGKLFLELLKRQKFWEGKGAWVGFLS